MRGLLATALAAVASASLTAVASASSTTASTTADPPVLFSCPSSSPLQPQALTLFSNFSYSITMGGALWLYGGKAVVNSGGVFYDSEVGTLSVASSGPVNGTDPSLGPYTAYQVNFTTPSLSPPLLLDTEIRCYLSPVSPSSAFTFTATFPNGAANTSTDGAAEEQKRRADAALLAPSSPLPPFVASLARRSAGRAALGAGEFNSSAYPSVQFPTFIAMPSNRLGGSLGFLEWNGRFTNDENAVGAGLVGFTGGQVGGPIVLFDAAAFLPGNGSGAAQSKPPALLLGALTSVKSVIFGIVEDDAHRGTLWRLSAGPQGHATSLPPGYTYTVAAVPTPFGVGNATYAYGDLLRAQGGSVGKLAGEPAALSSALADPLVGAVSYWTDNGAAYYGGYWPLNPDATATDVLTRLRAYHASIGLSVASYQLDPWWYPQDNGGCTNWTAEPSLFPPGTDSLVPLAEAGFGFTLYSSFYAGNLSRMAMPPFSFLESVRIDVGWFTGTLSRPLVNETYAFYSSLFERGSRWGMNAFEVDFMDFLNLLFAENNLDVTSLDAWERGLADAARDHGVPVQLCMDLPSDALFSASAPAFTNARASEDDFPTNDERWDIGTTSLLYGAVGLKPFYDDTWTSAVQNATDNPYGPSARENFTEVSIIVSTLSTGPVGISDTIGSTNMTLVNYTCMADGRILKPSLPAGAIDATFHPAAPLGSGARVWSAPSFIPESPEAAYPANPAAGTWAARTALPFLSLLAIDVPAPVRLYPWDLTPDLTVVGGTAPAPAPAPGSVAGYAALPWSPGMSAVAAACADGQPACACVSPFGPSAPLVLSTGGENADESKPHELVALAPVYANGYALVGEVAKITRVSVQRFAWAQAGADAASGAPLLAFAVNGTAGETVAVYVVVPPAGGAEGGIVAREGAGGGAGATPFPSSCAAPPLVRGPHADGVSSSAVVPGTMKVVSVGFASTGQKTVTCTGSGAGAACAVAGVM
jgi:hypothetical protein